MYCILMQIPGEESYLHDEPLSPSRALRAAMLRSRFAGTIVKAQQKALLDHVIFQKYVLNFVAFYLAMALQGTSLSLCSDAALADMLF